MTGGRADRGELRPGLGQHLRHRHDHGHLLADQRGRNTGTASFTVRDTTAPTITVPANITANATMPTGAVVTYSASASDVVDGPTAASCAPASGSTLAVGTITVTCSRTDLAGNTGTASFTVTVKGVGQQLTDLQAKVQTSRWNRPRGRTCRTLRRRWARATPLRSVTS